METIKRLTTATLTALWLFHGAVVAEAAQPAQPTVKTTQKQPVTDKFPPEQLEQLVAPFALYPDALPIALYPDALLAQLFRAATYPLDIVQADRWLGDHEDLQGEALEKAAAEEGWDPSVRALVFFPSVLRYMSDNLNWTQDFGDAVLAQQVELMDAVQRLRKEAQAAVGCSPTEPEPLATSGAALTEVGSQALIGVAAKARSRTFNTGSIAAASQVDEQSAKFLQVLTNETTGTGASPTSVFLLIQATTYDLSSQVCESDPVLGSVCRYTRVWYDFGSGEIPVADFAITTKAARLNTNIGNNAGFVFSRCTQDDVAGTTVCTDVPPAGAVQVSWARTSTNTYTSTGITVSKTGPEVVRAVGSTVQSSASVVGSMIGLPFISASSVGAIGTTKNLTIEITRGN